MFEDFIDNLTNTLRNYLGNRELRLLSRNAEASDRGCTAQRNSMHVRVENRMLHVAIFDQSHAWHTNQIMHRPARVIDSFKQNILAIRCA